ncbi:MAG TPA: hypothetical protein VES95_11840 [Dermatophilaceae bacterium]|nr:hypothetical protein [Dermatophilaceae bacterium]
MTDEPAVRRLLPRALGAWAGVSVAGGAVLVLAGRRGEDPRLAAAGRQHLAWGLVDGIIAVAAGRGLARPPRRPPEVERRRLRRLLTVNAVADLAYIAAGRAWAGRGSPADRGAGHAVVTHGAFLLVLDTTAALLLRERRHGG